MVIDLDRFKIMNDYLGHGSGDRLLVTIADRIRTSIRTNDFAARLGATSSSSSVDKAKSEMEILATAYRILDVIAQPVAIAGQEVTHTRASASPWPNRANRVNWTCSDGRRRHVRRQGPWSQPGRRFRP